MKIVALLLFCLAALVEAHAATPDYSAEPLVLEHTKTIFRYNYDGSGDRTMSEAIRLQSEAAVRQFGVLSFAYAGDSESVELVYVRVRKPDGKVVVTEASSAQDLPAEVTRAAPLYSDQRQLQVPVRGLSAGDQLEFEAIFHVKKSPVPGQFWAAINFEHTAMAPDQEVELRVPSSSKLIILNPLSKAETAAEKGETVYRWHASQLKPTVGASDEAIKPQALPDIAWTTFPSWAAVGAWYRALSANRAEPTPEIREKAAALISGANSEDEKLNRLYSFVSTQIRYVGIDFGIGRVQPHSAGEVLANGFGDCKDKHTLLAALLAAAGIESDPVLIGAGIELNRGVPAPNAFNHVITAVRRPGGQTLWLDATAEVAPAGLLLATLRGKDALLIPAQGASTLVQTPAAPPFPLYDRWDARASLASDGKLTAHFDLTMRGDLEYLFRAGLFAAGRAQWSQIGQNLSNALGFGGTVSEFQPANIDVLSDPLRLSYSYQRDHYADWEHHRVFAPMPQGLFSQNEPEKAPTEPIELGAPRLESAQSRLSLPDGYAAAALPKPVHISSPFAVYDIAYQQKGQDLLTEAKLQVLAHQVPVKDWEQYRAFAREVNENFGVFIDVRTGSAQATSAAVPMKDSGVVVQSDTSAEILLQQAWEAAQKGERAEARSKLEAARALNPAQPGLIYTAAYVDARFGNNSAAEQELLAAEKSDPNRREYILRMLANVQAAEKHVPDAISTLDTLRGLTPDDTGLARYEASLLTGQKRHEEAISLLEEANLKSPGDGATLVALGNAQIAAGRVREGAVSLRSALKGDEDPETLNDVAYALADQNLDLPLDHEKARKALGLLETKSQTASLDALTPQDLGIQRLLSATWDTVGWIAFREGNAAEAEPFLRSAWISSQRAEVGFHLGQAYEKEGKRAKVAEMYALTEAALDFARFQDAAAVRKRAEALAQAGFRPRFFQPPSAMLGIERTLDLPLLVKKQGTADFLLLADAALVEKLKFIEGDPAFRPAASALEAALNHNHVMLEQPETSKARLVRRGILSCSPLISSCQFVLFLPADTQLPAVRPLAQGRADESASTQKQ